MSLIPDSCIRKLTDAATWIDKLIEVIGIANLASNPVAGYTTYPSCRQETKVRGHQWQIRILQVPHTNHSPASSHNVRGSEFLQVSLHRLSVQLIIPAIASPKKRYCSGDLIPGLKLTLAIYPVNPLTTDMYNLAVPNFSLIT